MADFANLTLAQCEAAFPGGWSLKPDSMLCALRALGTDAGKAILNLGDGEGTRGLRSLCRDATVVSYENDPGYIQPGGWCCLWREFPRSILPAPYSADGRYDLVIVDGPHGTDRQFWYPLLPAVTRPGTIVVIDDVGHFECFENALAATFRFESLGEYRRYERRFETWLVVKLIDTVNA